jgi:hypothetical protein
VNILKELEFESHLLADENIISKTKAVRSRINKARMIERHFDESLDDIVQDDDMTYKALRRIKTEMKDTNGVISNALRKYYAFINNRSFPALFEYEQKKEKKR